VRAQFFINRNEMEINKKLERLNVSDMSKQFFINRKIKS